MKRKMHLGVGLDRAERLLLERCGAAVPHQDLQIGRIDDGRRTAAEDIHAMANPLRLPVAPAISRIVAGRACKHVSTGQARVEIKLLSELRLPRGVRIVAWKRDDLRPLVLIAQLGDRVVRLRPSVGRAGVANNHRHDGRACGHQCEQKDCQQTAAGPRCGSTHWSSSPASRRCAHRTSQPRVATYQYLIKLSNECIMT